MKKCLYVLKLESLAIADAKKRYPGLPESHYTNTRKVKINNANSLTKAVCQMINLTGNFAERVNTMGTPRDNRKVVTDCIGHKRQIGSLQWTKSTSTKGSADIHATINGRTVYIEIKWGEDKQSEAQKQFQTNVENAGAVYIIVKNFSDFYLWYEKYLLHL